MTKKAQPSVVACFLLGVLGGLLVTTGPAYAQSVPKYGLFETAITNTQSYANPFTGTTLTANFTSPSSQVTSIEGFYDGGQTWRLRFMPEELGQWSYTATFSDAAPGASGNFQCVAGNLHGPLRVKPANTLWFEHDDGTPFYLMSFHLWFICRLDSHGVLLSTLDYLKNQGFNAAIGPHLSESETLMPWVKNGSIYDFSRFNVTEWQRMDKVLEEMEARGMVHAPFNWFGGTNFVPKIDTPANEDLFLRFWVARWRGYWNATYQPIAEWEEGYSEAQVLNFLSRIRQLDNQRHIVSIHSVNFGTPGVYTSSQYTYHTIQEKLSAYDPQKYTGLVNLYNAANKPMLCHECLWEGNVYQGLPSLDMDNMRKGAWTIALSGGLINYADEVLPGRHPQTTGNYSPDFSEYGTEMQPGGWLYPYLTILGGTMRSLPFSQMTLQPSLSSTGICLGQTGVRYLAYAMSGGSMTLDLTSSPGAMQSRWLNPRTGVVTAPAAVSGGAVRSFTAPDASDWVLYVESTAVADTTGPAPITGLTATPGFQKNTLNWTYPVDADCVGVTIRFSLSGYPAGPTDGTLAGEEGGVPGGQDSHVHTGLTRATHYYSVFARDWFGNTSAATQISAIPFGLGDFDFDNDVDQTDFGTLQRCFSGGGIAFAPGCEAADLDSDLDVDSGDFSIFLGCMGGADQPPGC